MPMAANVSQSTEYNFHALNFYSTNICCFSSRSFFFSFFSLVLLYLFLWNNSSSASFSLNLHQFIFIIILFIIIGARTKVHFLVDMAGGGQNNNMKRASSSIFSAHYSMARGTFNVFAAYCCAWKKKKFFWYFCVHRSKCSYHVRYYHQYYHALELLCMATNQNYFLCFRKITLPHSNEHKHTWN